MKKRLLSLFTCLSIIFALSVLPLPTFAASTSDISAGNETEITIPILTEETLHDNARVTNFGNWLIYRSNGERCELHMTWSGSCSFSAFQYKKIEICSTSAFSHKTYDVLGDSENLTTINFPATSIGTAYIGVVLIPTNVDRVTVYTTKDAKVYDLTHGQWLGLSLNDFGKNVEVSSVSPESLVGSSLFSTKTSKKHPIAS